tara:strand:- start:765 stop:1109 length:345 start_codon:yes stop_codon:yes gene_type:complete
MMVKYMNGYDMGFFEKREDYRVEVEEKKYIFKIFWKWRCDDYGEGKEFSRMYSYCEVVERRKDIIELLEMFRGFKNYRDEINNKAVIEEFDKFMKWKDNVKRDNWDYMFLEKSK